MRSEVEPTTCVFKKPAILCRNRVLIHAHLQRKLDLLSDVQKADIKTLLEAAPRITQSMVCSGKSLSQSSSEKVLDIIVEFTRLFLTHLNRISCPLNSIPQDETFIEEFDIDTAENERRKGSLQR